MKAVREAQQPPDVIWRFENSKGAQSYQADFRFEPQWFQGGRGQTEKSVSPVLGTALAIEL